jgi:hypothetical protein
LDTATGPGALQLVITPVYEQASLYVLGFEFPTLVTVKAALVLAPAPGLAVPPSGVTETALESGTTVIVALLVSPYGEVALSVTVPLPLVHGPVVKYTVAPTELPGETLDEGLDTEQLLTLPEHAITESVYAAAVLPLFLIEKLVSFVEKFSAVYTVVRLTDTAGVALGRTTVT